MLENSGAVQFLFKAIWSYMQIWMTIGLKLGHGTDRELSALNVCEKREPRSRLQNICVRPLFSLHSRKWKKKKFAHVLKVLSCLFFVCQGRIFRPTLIFLRTRLEHSYCWLNYSGMDRRRHEEQTLSLNFLKQNYLHVFSLILLNSSGMMYNNRLKFFLYLFFA